MFDVNDLDGNQLFKVMAGLAQDLDELKSRQFTGGDSISVLLNETADTWDVDTTVPPTAGITWWEVLFTPDDAKFGFLQLEFDYLVTPDSGFEVFTSYPSPLPQVGPSQPYIVEYSNPNLAPVNVKLKFKIRSFGTGSLAWSIVRQEP